MARSGAKPPAKRSKTSASPPRAGGRGKTYTLLAAMGRVGARTGPDAPTKAAAADTAADIAAEKAAPFWKTKTLKQMNDAEWESLCDGCGKCCLVKLEDEETQELYFTGLHCKLLNPGTCQCSDYANRKKYVPECVKLTPDSIGALDWLPKTCAYKLVNEGEDLKDWHHLVCGDRNEVHRRGISAKGKVRSEVGIDDEDALDYLIDWAHGPVEKGRRKRKRA